MISFNLNNKIPISLYLPMLGILLVGVAFCSSLIVSQKYILLAVLLVLVIYLKLSLRLKMVLLLLGCFYPLSFGNVGQIQIFLWVEWMGPLVASILFYHIVSDKKSILPKKCLPAISAIFVLMVWAAINYMRHPVLAEKLMDVTEDAGGLRSYFTIFVGVCVFFSALWYSRYGGEAEAIWHKALWVLLLFSLFIGVLRAFSYFLSFDIPFVYGNFRWYYMAFSFSLYGGEAYRIGGLSSSGTVGIAALLALRTGKRFKVMDVFLFICFGMILFLSGGRAATLGMLVAFSFYCFITGFKRLGFIIAGIILFLCVVWLLINAGVLSGQINRLFDLEGGFREREKYRYLTYQLMWEQFLVNPVFGRGIGYFGKGLDNVSAFVFNQLKKGGHSSYMSILCIFGLGGAYFLGTMIISTFANGVRLLKNKIISKDLSTGERAMTIFSLFVVIHNSIEYIVGGNGYSDMKLYMLAGVMTGLYSRGRTEYKKT